MLFEGNILENVWGGFTQTGFSVLLTAKNQSLNGTNVCSACQVDDVTIRYRFSSSCVDNSSAVNIVYISIAVVIDIVGSIEFC